MSDVLIDSSVWIGFFRGDRSAVRAVDPLLEAGRVAITGPILAEVTSGARARADFALLTQKLGALTAVEPAEGVWGRVAQTRFLLARQGVQAHLIDLLIAHTAYDTRCELLTADRDFEAIAKVLPFAMKSLR